jgi:hypothetical protein
MGDGDLHSSKREVQAIRCKTCHGTLTEPPQTAVITDPDDVALRRAKLNGGYPLQLGDRVLVSENGEKLGAIRWLDGKLVQTLKVSGEALEIPLIMGSGCRQDPEHQESRACHECHAVERR